MFQEQQISQKSSSELQASRNPETVEPSTDSKAEQSAANACAPSIQVKSFSLRECASFIASDHLAAELKHDCAAAVFRHMAEQLNQQESVNTAALRKAYQRILTGRQGEVAKQFDVVTRLPESESAFHVSLGLREVLSIWFLSEASLRERLTDIFQNTAAQIERGDIQDAGPYCYQSDALVSALISPDAYLKNPY